MRDRKLTVALSMGLMMIGFTGCASSSAHRAPNGPAACGSALTAASAGTPVLAAAMRLSAVIQVSEPQSAHPKCFSLSPGSTVSLQVGDSVEFEANSAPQLSPDGSSVVTVSTRPGPTSSGPGDIGGLHTAHVIVHLAAVSQGSVTVAWIDCSGTGC